MKKLLLITTHTIAIAFGGAFVAGIFLLDIIPETKKYIAPDARYIKLTGDQDKPVDYEPILSKYFLGLLYSHHPLYKFKQEEGFQILSDLANQGYTPAAWYLHDYYIAGSYDLLAFSHNHGEFIMKDKQAYDQAYHWARLAAEQGFGGPLAQMLHYFKLPKYKDVTEDVKILEGLAPKSTFPTYAQHLSTYYTEQNMPEKAEHWRKVAEEIEAKPFKRPACEIITPWRGR